MEKCNSTKNPADPSLPLSSSMCPQTEAEIQEMKSIPYRSLVGGLLYLSNTTRPDIAYSVNRLARFLTNPGKLHWQAAKKVLRYLKGTCDLGLVFSGKYTLSGYADASWADNVDNRRSTAGFMVCGETGTQGTYHWQTKLLATPCQSSTEAEYATVTFAANEMVFQRGLSKSLGYEQISPTIINEDNQSCIALAENPVFHARTKHIELKHHVIRYYIETKQIKLAYCPTKEQLADILTKPLKTHRFVFLRDKILQ